MTTPAGKAAWGKEQPIFEHEHGEHIAAIQALADDNIDRYGLG
jgi:hypothetical protein